MTVTDGNEPAVPDGPGGNEPVPDGNEPDEPVPVPCEFEAVATDNTDMATGSGI